MFGMSRNKLGHQASPFAPSWPCHDELFCSWQKIEIFAFLRIDNNVATVYFFHEITCNVRTHTPNISASADEARGKPPQHLSL